MSDTDSPPDERRPRGRPRDPERMARVLEAAKRHFTDHGYEGASIDAIAEASGVSKVTIYSYFPTKGALFQAAITHRIDEQFANVDWLALDPKNPREALMRIGLAFLALMRSPDVINHHRTLYGAQGLDTAAAQSFFAAGPQRLVDAVAEYLRAAHRAGSLKVSDAALAANQYLSLFLGLGQVSALLGLALPTKREDEELLSANVELFLRALGRPAKPVRVARSGTRKT
jgi:TetR/AcrR family transcriptional repressor of mexJK operon